MSSEKNADISAGYKMDGHLNPMTDKDRDELLLAQSLIDVLNCLQTGKQELAADKIFALMPEYSDDYRVWHMAGLVSAARGTFEQAIVFLVQACQIDPLQVEPRLNLAKTYCAVKNYNAAAQCFAQVLQMDAENIPAMYGLATLFFNIGKYEQASEYLKHWLTIQEDPQAYVLLAQCAIKQQDYPTALELFSKAVELRPNDLALRMQFAGLLALARQFDQAITHYQYVLNKEPNNIDCLNQLGFLYYLEKDYAKAELYYAQVLKAKPNDLVALNNLSGLYKEMGSLKPAAESLQKIISLGNDTPEIQANLASVKFLEGDYAQAEQLYQEALRQSDNAKPIMQAYATALLREQKFKQAWPYFTKAFVDTERYGIMLPLWKGNKIKKQSLLLILDAQLEDIVLLSRFIAPLAEMVKHIYIYSPNSIMLKWMQECVGHVTPVKSLTQLPGEVACYTTLLSLPELLQVNKTKLYNHHSYVKTTARTLTLPRNSVLLALSYRLLNLPRYQQWIAELCQQHSRVYVYAQHPIPELDKKVQYLFDKDLVQLTNKINAFSSVITQDNLVGHIACALMKPCLVLLNQPISWHWPIPGERPAWYPTAKLLFPQT